MIRFKCSHCAKALGVPDTEAGKAIKCPNCGQKTRIPGEKPSAGGAIQPQPSPPPREEPADVILEEQEPALVEPVEAEPSVRSGEGPRTRKKRTEDFEDEEDEAPRKKSRRRGREEEEELEDDEEKGFMTPNRIRGIVGVLASGGVLAAFLLMERFKEGGDMADYQVGGFGLAGLLLVAGIFYLVKG